MQQFTSLTIQFSQCDQASVFYAHLQNIFKELYQTHLLKKYEGQQVLIKKIDSVLYDVYSSYLTLNKQYFAVSKNLKQMLTQCSQLMNQCKTDREQLVKVTQDRQAILQKLKLSTDQSLQIVQQNEKLYQQLLKMKEINQLLFEKNAVLEEQIENKNTTNNEYEKILKMSKQFERINSDNVSIQSDIADILKTTEMYGNASQPLQIMCLAFQQKPSLREELWDQIKQKHYNKFQNLQEAKNNFYNFKYIDALLLFSSKK